MPEPQEFRLANAHACYKAWVNLAINGLVGGSIVDPSGAPLPGVAWPNGRCKFGVDPMLGGARIVGSPPWPPIVLD